MNDESTLLLERSSAIADALLTKNLPKLREALVDLHPSDIADMVIALPPEHEGILFRVLPRQWNRLERDGTDRVASEQSQLLGYLSLPDWNL